jgi:hypothetical protein
MLKGNPDREEEEGDVFCLFVCGMRVFRRRIEKKSLKIKG